MTEKKSDPQAWASAAHEKRSFRRLWRDWRDAVAAGQLDEVTQSALAEFHQQLPTLWLLGKTGAGKTTIIQRITNDSRAEIGNGFMPCTPTAKEYDFPQEQPLLRFLDTRGLGEVDYDPAIDLAACTDSSHALLIVLRLDDTEQTELQSALSSRRRLLRNVPTLVIHTASSRLPDQQRVERARRYNQQTIETALGRSLPFVSVDFNHAEPNLGDTGLTELQAALLELLPEVAMTFQQQQARSAEGQEFLRHRSIVLGYATAAATVDALPAIGLVAVPGLQGRLLYSLANRYGLDWNTERIREFLATLGLGLLYRYGLSFAGRQLSKFVPVYGVTVGAVSAASISFASTFALGRAASWYCYRQQHQQDTDAEQLRAIFKAAFAEQRSATPSNKPKAEKPTKQNGSPT